MNAFYLLLITSYWGKPRVNRICRFNGIDVDLMFILKARLVENPEKFSFIMSIFLMSFFSIIIRVTELGYQRAMDFENYKSVADYEAEYIVRGNFNTYKNCIWNMFITMSTIGYGDFNVLSAISRFLLFFVAVSGLVIVSIMVVAYSEFFELDSAQAFCFRFFNALELKEKMRKEIMFSINYWTHMLYACRYRNFRKYKHYRSMLDIHIDNYKSMRF